MFVCLFAEHFSDDKDQKSTAKTTAKKQVDQRIAYSGEHGSHCCDHSYFKFKIYFCLKKRRVNGIDRTFTFQYSFEF
jgi:hypothetical protein